MKLVQSSKYISVLALAVGLLFLILITRDQRDEQTHPQSETASMQTDAKNPQTEEVPTPTLPTEDSTAETSGESEAETTTPSEVSTTAEESARSAETETETETEEPVYFRENREISQYGKVIMVGDSRFVGMSSAVSFAGCEWICDVSTGLDWLVDTAAPQIDAAITENCAIVFNMGVNDIDRAADYVSFLNSKVDGWTSAGADVYFMSVNPVDRSLYSGAVTNSDIVNFNNVMSANLDPWFGYIDTYNDLITNGFTSRDGLHYTNETYVEIFQYCMNQLHVAIS